MLSGPLVRTRKNEKKYKKYSAQRTNDCDFCDFSRETPQLIKESPSFWVVKNIFAYDIWDGVKVLDHLLVVPKRHVDTISHFTETESKEYMRILSAYEQSGYSIYSRAPQDITKSIAHQHTHLIKLGTQKARALLFVHKPHVLRYF